MSNVINTVEHMLKVLFLGCKEKEVVVESYKFMAQVQDYIDGKTEVAIPDGTCVPSSHVVEEALKDLSTRPKLAPLNPLKRDLKKAAKHLDVSVEHFPDNAFKYRVIFNDMDVVRSCSTKDKVFDFFENVKAYRDKDVRVLAGLTRHDIKAIGSLCAFWKNGDTKVLAEESKDVLLEYITEEWSAQPKAVVAKITASSSRPIHTKGVCPLVVGKKLKYILDNEGITAWALSNKTKMSACTVYAHLSLCEVFARLPRSWKKDLKGTDREHIRISHFYAIYSHIQKGCLANPIFFEMLEKAASDKYTFLQLKAALKEFDTGE